MGGYFGRRSRHLLVERGANAHGDWCDIGMLLYAEHATNGV